MNRKGWLLNRGLLEMSEKISNSAARQWIEQLGLIAHPEGGWYKEVYRSKGSIPANTLKEFEGIRSFSTSIYFLLDGKDFSAFHRIRSDELWHFYDGSSAIISAISPQGDLEQYSLGRNIQNNESFQVIIPAGWWFAAKVTEPDSFVLAGCTVSPGFDFKDFEMGSAEELIAAFPQHSGLISQLTR